MGHYEALEVMPKLNIDCILYVYDITSENLGLILRSADVFNINAVYYHQGNNSYNIKKLIKLSRNSRFPIHFSDGIKTLIDLKIMATIFWH